MGKSLFMSMPPGLFSLITTSHSVPPNVSIPKNKFEGSDNMEKSISGFLNLAAKVPLTPPYSSSIAFSGHIDTVPAGKEEWKVFKNPFSGKIKNGKMYGRGSADMKSGLISGFYALKCLKDLGVKLKGDVFAESVIDEE
ncbi:unnamed protein product, partial [marine sediment metagenome]